MSDDLIKRSDALSAAGDMSYIAFEIRRKIRMIPSVSNRPQGEWLDYEIPLEDGGAMPIQACSLCKTFYPLAYTGGGHRFCPNCGAKMSNASNASNTLETLEKGETE